MSTLKTMSPLILALIYTIIAKCEYTSPAPPPYSQPDPPSLAPTPAYYTPTPTTPSFNTSPSPGPGPSPGPSPHPCPSPYQVPTSAAVPISVPPAPAYPPMYGPATPTTPSYNVSPTPSTSPSPSPSWAPTSPSVPPAPSYPPMYGPAPSSSPIYSSDGIKAAYWPSFDGFGASSIDATYFTHIYYAFLIPEPATFRLNITQFDQEKLPEFIDALRARSPPVKTLLSIGGAGANATVFAKMASSKETRAAFIDSTIEVARDYGFDGLDLDWESPANDQEMVDFGSLIREWRRALAHEARATGKPRLLLTAAVYYSPKFESYGEPRAFPSEAINKYMDWINPMCYDYHGAWANLTGPNSALYDPTSNISTSYGIGSWIQSGVSPKKLVMGLPLYGRTWKLQDPNNTGIGAPATGPGVGDGMYNYNQILQHNIDNNAIVHYDEQTVSYYSVAGVDWIGYDGVTSVDLKVQFARKMGLAGYFFWALGQDQDWTISSLASNVWSRM